MSRYFDYVQAAKLVGRRIKTRIAWSGVPVGTTGRVVRADNSYTEGGRTRAVQGRTNAARAHGCAERPLVIEFQSRKRAIPGARPSIRSHHRHLEVLP